MKKIYILLLTNFVLGALFSYWYHRSTTIGVVFWVLCLISWGILGIFLEEKLEKSTINNNKLALIYLFLFLLMFSNLGVLFGTLIGVLIPAVISLVNFLILHYYREVILLEKENSINYHDFISNSNPNMIGKMTKRVHSANYASIFVIFLIFLGITGFQIMKTFLDREIFVFIISIYYLSISLINVIKLLYLSTFSAISKVKLFFETAVILGTGAIQYLYEGIFFPDEVAFSPYLIAVLSIISYPVVYDQKIIAKYLINLKS